MLKCFLHQQLRWPVCVILRQPLPSKNISSTSVIKGILPVLMLRKVHCHLLDAIARSLSRKRWRGPTAWKAHTKQTKQTGALATVVAVRCARVPTLWTASLLERVLLFIVGPTASQSVPSLDNSHVGFRKLAQPHAHTVLARLRGLCVANL